MIKKIKRKLKRAVLEKKLRGFKNNKDIIFTDYLSKKKLNNEIALESLNNGKILYIPKLIQELNLIEDFEKLVGYPIQDFPSLHKLMNHKDIVQKIANKRSSLDTLLFQTKIILTIGEILEKPIFCELEPNLRIHFPFKIIKNISKKIEKRLGTGQASPHSIHKDSWYYHPKKTVNIWVAGTPVDEFNGLSILPESHNYYPDFYSGGLMKNLSDAITSEHVTLRLNPGDAVVFLSENIHSSILNQSDITRLALSMRFSLEKPSSQALKSYWYEKARKKNGGWVFTTEVSKKKLFDPKSIVNKFHKNNNNNNLNVSSKSISVNINKNEKLTFPRFCSHEKADLKNSYFCSKDNTLICPLHRKRVKGSLRKTV